MAIRETRSDHTRHDDARYDDARYDDARPDDTRYDDFVRARLFFDAGQPAEAVRILDPMVLAEPDVSVLELHARALFASAQLERAEQAFRGLVDRCPDDGWAHVALGRTLERLHRQAEAEPCFRTGAALGHGPDRPSS